MDKYNKLTLFTETEEYKWPKTQKQIKKGEYSAKKKVLELCGTTIVDCNRYKYNKVIDLSGIHEENQYDNHVDAMSENEEMNEIFYNMHIFWVKVL